MKKVSTLLMLLVAFCGIAWAQGTTSLPFKVSDAPSNGQWAQNTKWHYMKPSHVDSYHPAAWISAGSGYVHTDGALKLKNATQPNDDYGLWCVVGNETDGFKFYNKGKGTSYVLGMTDSEANAYAKMYDATNPGQGVTVEFIYGASTKIAGSACFKLKGSANNWWNNRDTGHTGGPHLALWNNAKSGPNDNGSAFTFIEADSKDYWTTMLTNKIAEAKPYEVHMGTGLNQYSQSASTTKPLNTAITEAEALLNAAETTVQQLEAAYNELKSIVDGITINQPATGRFYALKSKASGRFVDGSTAMDFVPTSVVSNNEFKAGNLFYLTSDKKLLGYATGYYFINTRQIGKGDANTWEFLPSTGYKGFYLLKASPSGKNGRFLFGHSGTETKCDRTSSYVQDKNDWTIVEVTTLPVTVSAAGWATLYAPVALTIPSDVTAYTGKVNGNALKLTALTNTIPANTPVLLKANAGTYNFPINYEAKAQTIDQSLTGTIETKAKPAQGTIFTLQKDATAGLGLFKFTGTDLQGFRIYGVDLLGSTSAAAGLVFEFDDVTGIDGITMDDHQQTVIYDLSGRRVAKAQKGMYIINGKKVIIR